MINPQGTDSPNEFVELVNNGVVAVDLTGMRLGDLNSTDELSSDSLILWPGEYAVIFEGDYSPDSGAYAGLLPPGTHTLFVDDNSIYSFTKVVPVRLLLAGRPGDRIESVFSRPTNHALDR